MTTQSLERIDTAQPAKTEAQFPGVAEAGVAETYAPDPLEVHFGRPLPVQLIRLYSRFAARRADTERLEDGTWFASIRGFPGVWAQGGTEDEALEAIKDVLVDWACLKIVDGDKDLPVVNTIDLNVP